MKNSKQFVGSEIWIDGFTDFTPQEYKIIEVLLTQAERVTITLVCDNLDGETSELDIFSPSKKVYRKVLNLAVKNNIRYEPPVFLNPKLYTALKIMQNLPILKAVYIPIRMGFILMKPVMLRFFHRLIFSQKLRLLQEIFSGYAGKRVTGFAI